MNYQVALTISYIFRLVNELGDYYSPNYSRLVRCDFGKGVYDETLSVRAVPASSHRHRSPVEHSVNYKINVVNIQDKFYIQDSKQNLHFIQEENAQLPKNFIKNLNTLIYFEKFKKRPIESMIYLKKIINHSHRPCIDFDLLSKLQIQLATDPSYFDS